MWRRAWLTALGTWSVAATTYLMVNVAFWTVTGRPSPRWQELLNVWNRWDTGHYLYIATHGYNPATENPAFFPLYPILIWLVNPVFPGEALAAGLFVSSACTIAALAFVYRLADDLFDVGTASRAVLYLVATPMGFFLVAAYNESLLLMLCAGSLYFMRRGLWWQAGAFAGLASGARQAGLLLILAFGIEYLRQRDWRLDRVRWDALALLLAPTGVLAFMIYSNDRFGDPLKFVHMQSFWGRELSWPWRGVAETADDIGTLAGNGPLSTWVILNVIDLASLFVMLGLLVACLVGPWRLGPQAWYITAFGIAVWLMIILPPMGRDLPPLHGLPRYALEIVPIYLVLARMGTSRAFERAYLLPMIGLQAALLIGFFANVWLA